MCFTASKAVQEHSLAYVICCGLCVLGKKTIKKQAHVHCVVLIIVIIHVLIVFFKITKEIIF